MAYEAIVAAIRMAKKSVYADIAAGTLDGDKAIEFEGLFPEWAPGKYAVNDVRRHGGQVWRCCQEHDNAHNPDVEPGKTPAIWVPYHTKNPKYAKPFIRPTMAEDSYKKGECCLWTDGTVRRSTMDGNTYTPDEYPAGWEVAG